MRHLLDRLAECEETTPGQANVLQSLAEMFDSGELPEVKLLLCSRCIVSNRNRGSCSRLLLSRDSGRWILSSRGGISQKKSCWSHSRRNTAYPLAVRCYSKNGSARSSSGQNASQLLISRRMALGASLQSDNDPRARESAQ